MKIMGIVIGSIVLAGLVVTAGWLWGDGTVPNKPAVSVSAGARDNARIQQLEQQVAQMNAELKKQEKAQRRPVFNFQWHGAAGGKSGSDSTADTAVDTTAQPSQIPPSPVQGDGEAQRTLIGNLENQFDSESRDNTWSANASAAITGYFDKLSYSDKGQNSTLDSVDCRATLCKVEVTNANAEAAQEFAMTFPMAVGPELPSATYDYHPRSNGRVDLTLYLSKQVN